VVCHTSVRGGVRDLPLTPFSTLSFYNENGKQVHPFVNGNTKKKAHDVTWSSVRIHVFDWYPVTPEEEQLSYTQRLALAQTKIKTSPHLSVVEMVPCQNLKHLFDELHRVRTTLGGAGVTLHKDAKYKFQDAEQRLKWSVCF
jgi:hypothetical protein